MRFTVPLWYLWIMSDCYQCWWTTETGHYCISKWQIYCLYLWWQLRRLSGMWEILLIAQIQTVTFWCHSWIALPISCQGHAVKINVGFHFNTYFIQLKHNMLTVTQPAFINWLHMTMNMITPSNNVAACRRNKSPLAYHMFCWVKWSLAKGSNGKWHTILSIWSEQYCYRPTGMLLQAK